MILDCLIFMTMTTCCKMHSYDDKNDSLFDFLSIFSIKPSGKFFRLFMLFVAAFKALDIA